MKILKIIFFNISEIRRDRKNLTTNLKSEPPRNGHLRLVCRSGVLLEDIGTYRSDLVHPGLYHAFQDVGELGGESQALFKKERKYDMPSLLRTRPRRPRRGCLTMFLTIGRRTCRRSPHRTAIPLNISSEV